MKISRDARTQARSLYRQCLKEGSVDMAMMQTVISELLTKRPRGFLAIATRIKTLLQLEVNRRTFRIESALPLPDEGKSLFSTLETRFGIPLDRSYAVNPKLIGGLRIQVGSIVWDGSIRQKLHLISPTLN